jgi:DNA-binding response OmpR family regulator
MDLLNSRREGAAHEGAAAAPVPPAAPEPQVAAATILVIDDEDFILRLHSRFLGAGGRRVLVAGNGWVGLELARRERPDLILLDINMPGMDGLTVFKHLQADPLTAGIRVILMTGLDVPETMLKAAAAHLHIGEVHRKEAPLPMLGARVEAELAARVRLVLNENLCEVALPGTASVVLPPKRFQLLKELMASPEGVSCSRLLDAVWAGLAGIKTLHSTIRRLRDDLGAFEGCRIEATKDGYRLKISQ